jgi:hypothetical protein
MGQLHHTQSQQDGLITMNQGFDDNQAIELFQNLQQQALNSAQLLESSPAYQLGGCGMKLVDHIAKLKVLYRSARFSDDVTDEQMLDSCPGDFGDSILIEHLIKEAIALHTELSRIKSRLE